MFGGQQSVFNFGLKISVDKKEFDGFYDCNRSSKSDHFVEKGFVLNTVKDFLHVEKYKSNLNVIVMILAKWMSEFS